MNTSPSNKHVCSCPNTFQTYFSIISISYHLIFPTPITPSCPFHKPITLASLHRQRWLFRLKPQGRADPPGRPLEDFRSLAWKPDKTSTMSRDVFPSLKLTLRLMEESGIHLLIWRMSHYKHGCIHPRWCRISSSNRSYFQGNFCC